MSGASRGPDGVYCPRCRRAAPDGVVFCRYCGQFVHARAPADSRPWDSRPPELPSVAPAAPAPTRIDLSAAALPYQAADAGTPAEPAAAPAEASAADGGAETLVDGGVEALVDGGAEALVDGGAEALADGGAEALADGGAEAAADDSPADPAAASTQKSDSESAV